MTLFLGLPFLVLRIYLPDETTMSKVEESFDNYSTPIIDSLNFKELQDADDTYQSKDYKEAVRLFRLSAEQGVVLAQYNLGLMYAKGEGVLQDYTLAHMWWSICGTKLHEGCVKNRYIVEKKITSEQWKKSMKMAINWKPKK